MPTATLKELLSSASSSSLTFAAIDDGIGGLKVVSAIESELSKLKFGSPMDVDLLFFDCSMKEGNFPDLPLQDQILLLDGYLRAISSLASAIVLACHTYSTIYERTNFAAESSLPVILMGSGVIAYNDFVQSRDLRKTAPIYFGTKTTKRRLDVEIIEGVAAERAVCIACPKLATSVACGKRDVTEALIKQYAEDAAYKLNELKLGTSLETVIVTLCCTHYSFVASLFESAMRECLPFVTIEVIDTVKTSVEVLNRPGKRVNPTSAQEHSPSFDVRILSRLAKIPDSLLPQLTPIVKAKAGSVLEPLPAAFDETPSPTRPRCLVLGSGVNGLTCALRLLKEGYDVHLIAEEIAGSRGIVFASSCLAQTTSNGAGAIWEFPPFGCSPQKEAREWLLQGRAVFELLSANKQETGVHLRPQTVVSRSDNPDNINAITDFKNWSFVNPDFTSGKRGDPDAPDSFEQVNSLYNCYTWYTSPIAFMPRYLNWLYTCCRDNGATFTRSRFSSIQEALRIVDGKFNLVVNCLGLGATATGDKDMFPARGALVYLYAPEVTSFYEDIDRADEDLTYIVPQENGVIACAGSSGGEEDFGLENRIGECEAVLRRCRDILPILKDAPILGEWVGLRPKRKGGIRLELTKDEGYDVINNYGHGGSGVVLSWGCAHSVASLAREVAKKNGLGLHGIEIKIVLGKKGAVLPSLEEGALTEEMRVLLKKAEFSLAAPGS
ncbi:hypothetical protein TrVE_jg2598 [Triparma verrucosa]|uniref:FAD dependent oxidoreductase domain-containing protein n=1 Tax=Triparma verrucosa TaxID=1606542 RepID=A0A9W7BRD1_9STRA|nr:hypothetical protein TrVE_jg2598 [Triparma verrucosa]